MYKRIGLTVALVLSLVSVNSYAVSPGFYVGLQVGPAMVSNNASTANRPTPPGGTTPVTPTRKIFGGRVLVGYKFNPWIAWESGLNFFSIVNYHASVPTCNHTQVGFAVFDTVLKPSITIGPVDVFAKLGVAVNYIKNTASMNRDGTCNKSFHQYTFGAVYGLDANYTFNQRVVADIAWTRIHVGPFVNNVDFYTIGIAYHFVDVYCGQFLCDE